LFISVPNTIIIQNASKQGYMKNSGKMNHHAESVQYQWCQITSGLRILLSDTI